MSITERIVEESAKMFVQEGVRAVRMDDIANRLSISKRTIYELFKDKDTLIEHSLKYHFDMVTKTQEAKIAGADNVIEEFILLLDDWDRTMQDNYNLMEGVRKFYPQIYEKFFDGHNMQKYERFKKEIARGITQGLFLRHINIDLAVSVFAESIYAIVTRADQNLPNNISAAEAFKYIILYFFRGISTDKGITIIDNYINNK